jgi:hypothetical protein
MQLDRKRLAELLLSAYGFALACRPFDEADTFFHLSLGRAVLRAGSRIVPEPTAFADFSAPAVASEWLWSVLSYAVYALGGYPLLVWLGCLLAAAACWSAVRLAWRTRGAETSDALVHGISVLAVCVVMCRISVRPELALLCALPWYVIGARAYPSQRGARRLQLGLSLAAAAVLWAQLHASFVLCPVIFAIYAIAKPERREQLRTDGLVLLALLAALMTSPYGAGISELISSHAAGDAPRFIHEMARTTWSMLDPFAAPTVLAYFVLLGFAASGMVIERSWYARDLALALLGCALLATANRFIAEAALLAVPLANQGARALTLHFGGAMRRESLGAHAPRPRGRLLTVAAVGGGSLALLVLTGLLVQRLHGPLGRADVAAHAFPLYAARALESLPRGSHVFTDYNASAVVGFVGADRLRTFVDGRTPLYFDATDFAVSRDMSRDATALHNGLQRYSVRAAVARRDSEVCMQLAKRWSVALVEPLYTTFVESAGQAPISRLRPCGMTYMGRESCDGEPDIAQVRSAGAHAFASFLEAERSVHCDADIGPALASLRALARDAGPYSRYFERVFIEALLRSSQWDEAKDHMLGALNEQDLGVVGMLQHPAAGNLPLSEAKEVLEAYVDRTGDEADLGVRAALAEICARSGDAECARFHGIRAAIHGRPTSALTWLAEHHEDERIRRDATRWLEVLNQTDPAAALTAP